MWIVSPYLDIPTLSNLSEALMNCNPAHLFANHDLIRLIAALSIYPVQICKVLHAPTARRADIGRIGPELVV
jgi:hypothetical protein